MLKLTSSAVLFLGVEKGYFKEFGVEPELVYFQAAQPIAVALASGDIPVGATGLTAGLYNIVAGGVRIWIVADKGREWPNHNLTALVVRKDLYDGGVRSMRDLKGKKIGVTQIGSTFHYNVGRYLEKEGLGARRRRAGAAAGAARAQRRAHRPAGRRGGHRRAVRLAAGDDRAPASPSSRPATRFPGRSPP